MAKIWVDLDFLEDGLKEICDAIREKTGGTGKLAFPVEIKSAVESIETGSGGITPTGTKTITANGEGIDVTTYAAVDVAVPSSGSDTSDATAAAADIAADKTAYIATGKTTGSAAVRTGSDLTEGSGGMIMVPAGIYRASTSKSVAGATQATPGISVDQLTGLITASAIQSAGYVAAGTKSSTLQLSAKSAQTYTPGTADQEIPAGKYTTGKQTIKGDAKLVSGNIKSGVQIFGVTGSYQGGGGTPSVTVKDNSVAVSRTSTKMLAISGLTVGTGETLVGLFLNGWTGSDPGDGYIETMTVLQTEAYGWAAFTTMQVGSAILPITVTDITLTKYGETNCTLNLTGSENFMSSYYVSPIVAKVN